MITIKRSKTFRKHFRARIAPNKNLTQQFADRVYLFTQGERGHPLNDHALQGNKEGLRSFSIRGDVRVIYTIEDDGIVFLDVGSHNQVYGK